VEQVSVPLFLGQPVADEGDEVIGVGGAAK
jgi:hypothetical protein